MVEYLRDLPWCDSRGNVGAISCWVASEVVNLQYELLVAAGQYFWPERKFKQCTFSALCVDFALRARLASASRLPAPSYYSWTTYQVACQIWRETASLAAGYELAAILRTTCNGCHFHKDYLSYKHTKIKTVGFLEARTSWGRISRNCRDLSSSVERLKAQDFAHSLW